jgi:dienelactone hydrolase
MSSPCCADPGAKQNHSAHGCEEQIGGVNTYKTGQGKSSIVIFTDIFGYSFINIRKVADQFAQGSQTTVLIPDLFNGDAMSPDLPNIWDLLPGWLKKHPPTDGCNIADKFISTIKGHYQSIQVNKNYLSSNYLLFLFI